MISSSATPQAASPCGSVRVPKAISQVSRSKPPNSLSPARIEALVEVPRKEFSDPRRLFEQLKGGHNLVVHRQTVDRQRWHVQHWRQRAPGRLLSAAREPAPTQCGSPTTRTFVPALTQRTPGTTLGRSVEIRKEGFDVPRVHARH